MAEKVLMKGNEALAEAAIQAGCRHFFGYSLVYQIHSDSPADFLILPNYPSACQGGSKE